MALVALVFCLAFIIFGLRQESREKGKFPGALWVPFIWIIVSASRPISSWLNPSRALIASSLQDYIQGNPTERLFLIMLISLGVYVLIRRRGYYSLPIGPNIWLFALYFLALMSIGWADYQGVSFRRWIRAAGDIIMVLVILTEDDHEEALERVLRRCAIILIPLSVVLIRWFRMFGVLYNVRGASSWAGVSTGKNELGLLCAFLGVFLVWRFIKTWPRLSLWEVLEFLMILYLLHGAKSSTSYVVLFGGTILLFVLSRVVRNWRMFNILIVSSIVLILVMQWISIGIFGESMTPLFFSATGRDATFTGRTLLWQELISIGGRNTVAGVGYGNFWIINMTHFWNKFVWGPTNAHNGYLDVFLELGLIGLTVLLLLIAKTYSKILHDLGGGRPFGKLQIVFFIMILAHNVTETHIMRPTNFLWILFLLMAMKISQKAPTPNIMNDQGPEAPTFRQ